MKQENSEIGKKVLTDGLDHSTTKKKIFKNLQELKMFAIISRNLVKKLLMPRCGRGGM